MYKPIIEVMATQVHTQIEGEILKAVQKIGVHVDKEELLKALRYDREQYEQGFEDGLNANKWIPCSEKTPEESLCSVIGWDEYRKRPVFIQFYDGSFQNMGSTESFKISAWMPLPEPYEEGDEIGTR